MRDTYGEMMLNLWQERFSNVFSEDNYTPIYLETIDDVDDCLLGFPCEFSKSYFDLHLFCKQF